MGNTATRKKRVVLMPRNQAPRGGADGGGERSLDTSRPSLGSRATLDASAAHRQAAQSKPGVVQPQLSRQAPRAGPHPEEIPIQKKPHKVRAQANCNARRNIENKHTWAYEPLLFESGLQFVLRP